MSAPAAIRVWESHFTLYRTIWRSNVLGAFVQPFLYLLGMGLGVGALVDRGADSADLLDGLTYYQFLAPGLLATTAMMISAQESMWPVMAGFKWQRTFHAQAASPLSPAEITGGLALWQTTRSVISVTGVAAVLALFEGTRSWGLLLAIPFGGLTGVAFAAPISAWAATREREGSFPSIMRFGIMPLFLFGGAFYPISQLPDWLEPVARVTPIWHGVELCRGAVHDRLGVGAAAVHVAVLAGFALVGWGLARVAFAVEAREVTLSDLPLRIIPAPVLQARRPQRLLERHFIINRSGGWALVLSGFFEPLFYLVSIRVGFAALVGDVDDGGRIVSYAEFVAPALMAASAMNGAVFESTMNVFFQLKYDKVYDAALATPLTAGDVALGEILYATFRGALYSTAFLVTIVALGMAPSVWIVLALPYCVLIVVAFSAVGMAATTFMRSFADFEYVPSLTLPLFLFSATFYPLSSYGDWAWVAQLSPLYHGVALVRGASYGEWTWAIIPHLAVFVVLAAVGLSITARRIERLLLQ